MSRRILVVTRRDDPHADRVVGLLRARGATPFRLDLDAYPARYRTALAFDGRRWTGTLRDASGDALAVEGIGAVWARKRAPFAFDADLSAQERAFAEGEAEHALTGLLHALDDDVFWMSHPAAVRGALWKPEQLARAARIGFDAPPSLVTDDPAAAARFRDACGGDIVFKTLSSPFLGAEAVDDASRTATGIATTRIDGENASLLDAVGALPCFFQRHVPKRHEVRATVVGPRVFAAKIHSQDDARTAVDYRRFDIPVRYEAIELPEDAARRCVEFVASYGLAYGAIDLIAPADGGPYVFLENNPGGQFLFVEQLAPALKIADAVADALLAGARAGG